MSRFQLLICKKLLSKASFLFLLVVLLSMRFSISSSVFSCRDHTSIPIGNAFLLFHCPQNTTLSAPSNN